MSFLFHFSLLIKHFACVHLCPCLFVVDPGGPPMCLFWTWFGFWVQRGVGFAVCLRLALLFSLYSLFRTRHSCFASRILEARDSFLQFSGSVPFRSLAQGTQPFVGALASPEMVSSRTELGVLTNLRFRDPGHFKAGMLHESCSLHSVLHYDRSWLFH